MVPLITISEPIGETDDENDGQPDCIADWLDWHTQW